MVGWEITRQCNLSCPHCYSAAERRARQEMSPADCFRIIDTLAEWEVKAIGWTGGEPLMRTELEEVIAYASERGIKSGITTNGILLDEKRATSLKEAGATFIQISLDGSSAEKNQNMRKATVEDYDAILGAIRACQKLEMRLDLAMLIGQENLDDAAAFIKLAQREGVKRVRFCGFVPWGRGKHARVMERLSFNRRLPDLKVFIEKASQLENPVVMFDPAFGPLPPEYLYHECVAGVKLLYISAFGDVYPCTSLLAKEFAVGNIHERELAEIWDDPRMTQVSDFPRESIHGPCRECPHFSDCRGACRGISFAHTGDINASFPVCLYWA